MTKAWPEDGSTVSFSDLADPFVDAVRFAYKLERQNVDRDIPYDGYEIGKSDQANCLLAADTLTAASLEYAEEEQGRDALTEIIGLAIRVGLEQGRRMLRKSPEFGLLETRAKIGQMHVEALQAEKIAGSKAADETMKRRGVVEDPRITEAREKQT